MKRSYASAATVACNDDSSPPGDDGSRIAVALDPATYYLIVDGFDASEAGPFTWTRGGDVAAPYEKGLFPVAMLNLLITAFLVALRTK